MKVIGVKRFWISWVKGITLWPFGIYYQGNPLGVYQLNHEKIHWQQQKETAGIIFYLWYVIEWFIKLFKYGRLAYYEISFEREAFARQTNLKYIETRKLFTWVKYILQ